MVADVYSPQTPQVTQNMKHKYLLQQTKVPSEEKWCWLLWVTLLCKMSANESLAFVYLSEVHWKLKMTSNSELTSNQKEEKKPSTFQLWRERGRKLKLSNELNFYLAAQWEDIFELLWGKPFRGDWSDLVISQAQPLLHCFFVSHLLL